MTATYNITCPRNTGWTTSMTYRQPNTTPFNLTSFTGKMQVRASAGGTMFAELTSENGRISFGGSDGRITLTIPQAVTKTFAFERAVYDLVLIPPSGQGVSYRLLQGQFIIDPGVTSAD